MSASLIGRSGSRPFRLSTNSVSTPLAGSCFSSESAPRTFHHGIRRRGGTIFGAALPLDEPQVTAELGPVNPDAVHDHGQSTSQGHNRLFQPAVPGDLHRPGLEP